MGQGAPRCSPEALPPDDKDSRRWGDEAAGPLPTRLSELAAWPGQPNADSAVSQASGRPSEDRQSGRGHLQRGVSGVVAARLGSGARVCHQTTASHEQRGAHPQRDTLFHGAARPAAHAPTGRRVSLRRRGPHCDAVSRAGEFPASAPADDRIGHAPLPPLSTRGAGGVA
eukprot:ctg_324.g206